MTTLSGNLEGTFVLDVLITYITWEQSSADIIHVKVTKIYTDKFMTFTRSWPSWKNLVILVLLVIWLHDRGEGGKIHLFYHIPYLIINK